MHHWAHISYNNTSIPTSPIDVEQQPYLIGGDYIKATWIGNTSWKLEFIVGNSTIHELTISSNQLKDDYRHTVYQTSAGANPEITLEYKKEFKDEIGIDGLEGLNFKISKFKIEKKYNRTSKK